MGQGGSHLTRGCMAWCCCRGWRGYRSVAVLRGAPSVMLCWCAPAGCGARAGKSLRDWGHVS